MEEGYEKLQNLIWSGQPENVELAFPIAKSMGLFKKILTPRK